MRFTLLTLHECAHHWLNRFSNNAHSFLKVRASQNTENRACSFYLLPIERKSINNANLAELPNPSVRSTLFFDCTQLQLRSQISPTCNGGRRIMSPVDHGRAPTALGVGSRLALIKGRNRLCAASQMTRIHQTSSQSFHPWCYRTFLRVWLARLIPWV